MARPERRFILIALVSVALLTAPLARPVLHLTWTALRDERGPLEGAPPGFVDDASRMNRTRVALVWDCPPDAAKAEVALASLVRGARADGLRISIAGARHSMGGQTIRPGGIVVNMRPLHRMELDEAREVLHVEAGALWSEVLPYLNARGRSVAVMQSNHSFTVGGSISVDCHGWQARRPPIASTVEALRLLTVDGRALRCSRAENSELFSLVLGGYGLFGIVLDVDLYVVPNEGYRLERIVVPTRGYAAAFAERAQGADVGMAYGRLSVDPDSFLKDAILNILHRVPSEEGKPSSLVFPEIPGLTRTVFRGQVGSDYGKRLRWQAEKRLVGMWTGIVHRNQLLSEPVEVFENRSVGSTDILQEYFVPPEAFEAFLTRVRGIVRSHDGDLLNVTVRDVLRDEDAFLRYADRDLFALVMLFHHARTAEGDARMEAMTRDLIDAALAVRGRYYLPYRLHATVEQFRRAYPQAHAFFEKKRRYDPDGVFENAFALKYGGV